VTSLLREREGKVVGTLKRADVHPQEVGEDDPLLGPVSNEIMLRERFWPSYILKATSRQW